MRLRLPVLALVVALGGCGEDEPTAEERRGQLVAQLSVDLRTETDGALDEEAATCVSEALVDTVGEERFEEIIAAAGGDGDPELQEQVVDVFASCDALDPVLEGS